MTMTEDQLEQEALGWLADVGWQHRYGPDLAPDGLAPERDNYRQVLLIGRLRQAVAALNPDVPQSAREDALKQVVDLGTPALLAANRQFHRLLVTGVSVQYRRDGETRGDFVRLVDWGDPARRLRGSGSVLKPARLRRSRKKRRRKSARSWRVLCETVFIRAVCCWLCSLSSTSSTCIGSARPGS